MNEKIKTTDSESIFSYMRWNQDVIWRLSSLHNHVGRDYIYRKQRSAKSVDYNGSDCIIIKSSTKK